MNIQSLLAKTTVKIVCDNGSTGTGFFFQFHIDENRMVPVVITNRHVVESAQSIEMVFSLNDYFTSPNKTVNLYTFEIENVQHTINYHDDPNIDICRINISQILEFQKKNNLNFHITFLSNHDLPSDEDLEKLRYVEDVLMVGYPRGLSDTRNNFPMFRRGSTATHPAVDFEGRPEFIVDMTITNGSSGSPVFIYNPNGYTDNDGNTYFGNERLMFLGINKAVYTMNVSGEIVEIQSPTRVVTSSNIGINLGVIIKAKVIEEMYQQLLSQLS